ncbi:MAG: UUP1 family membrane protein [Dissulfurispiraceae bacterium]
MNRSLYALVFTLLAISLSLISYRIFYLDYPLFPPIPEKVWQLTMEVGVSDGNEGTALMVGLPSDKQGIAVLEEDITEGPLNFRLFSEGPNRFGIWSGTAGPDGSLISYRSTLVVKPGVAPAPSVFQIGPYPTGINKQEQDLAEKLMTEVRRLPLYDRLQAVDSVITENKESFPRVPEYLPEDVRAWAAIQKRLGYVEARLILLRAAGISAYAISGLKLQEGVTSKTSSWIEIWTGRDWKAWQTETGLQQEPNALLPLTRGTLPAVRKIRGAVSEIRWSLSKRIMNQWDLQYARIRRSNRLLDRWSLFRLPLEYQGTFRILILVPLGAFMICILRNVIGFPTFGIFMPVLMALAFRNTGLGYGMGIFATVLLIGYTARRSLEKIRLLLVPRLSVILTFVIACFIIFALIGNKFELKAFMAIGLLPFVILTMAIERFFIIVEEEGTKKGLITAAGSAAVATITYGIIQFDPLQLTFFVYPELLLVVMAAQVLLGRYTGYRLSEFLRFRNMKVGA